MHCLFHCAADQARYREYRKAISLRTASTNRTRTVVTAMASKFISRISPREDGPEDVMGRMAEAVEMDPWVVEMDLRVVEMGLRVVEMEHRAEVVEMDPREIEIGPRVGV